MTPAIISFYRTIKHAQGFANTRLIKHTDESITICIHDKIIRFYDFKENNTNFQTKHLTGPQLYDAFDKSKDYHAIKHVPNEQVLTIVIPDNEKTTDFQQIPVLFQDGDEYVFLLGLNDLYPEQVLAIINIALKLGPVLNQYQIEQAKNRVNRKESSLQILANDTKDKVTLYEETVQQKNNELEQLGKLISGFSSTNKKISDDIKDILVARENYDPDKILIELTEISSIKKVRSVRVEDSNLIISLAALEGKIDGIKHDSLLIPPLDVLIDLTTTSQPVSYRCSNKMFRGIEHPHVRNGGPCLGNSDEAIVSLARSLDFSLMISMIITWLESCNIEDEWGQSGLYWPSFYMSNSGLYPAHLPRMEGIKNGLKNSWHQAKDSILSLDKNFLNFYDGDILIFFDAVEYSINILDQRQRGFRISGINDMIRNFQSAYSEFADECNYSLDPQIRDFLDLFQRYTFTSFYRDDFIEETAS